MLFNEIVEFLRKKNKFWKKKKEKDGFVRIIVIVWRVIFSEVIMRGEI